jgi:hypothetical protein
VSRERDFNRWVRERLSDWPMADVLAFERWLLEEQHFEFVPAVHEAWLRKGAETDRAESWRGHVVDDLLARLKGLIRVKTLLEERGASVIELAEHTAEIERLRAQLAEAVKTSAA